MKRIISVITRSANGRLTITKDAESVECDAKFSGVEDIIEERKDAGDTMVMVLLEDGSLSRHWCLPTPAEEPVKDDAQKS